jgi:hypothetical protein
MVKILEVWPNLFLNIKYYDRREYIVFLLLANTVANNYIGILQIDDVTTPIVSNVFDGSGELIAGVASVGAVVRILQHIV